MLRSQNRHSGLRTSSMRYFSTATDLSLTLRAALLHHTRRMGILVQGILTHHIPNCILNYVFLLFDGGITLVGVHFQRCPKVLSEVCESVRLPSPLFDELVVLPPCKLLDAAKAWFLATIQKLAKETHEMHDL